MGSEEGELEQNQHSPLGKSFSFKLPHKKKAISKFERPTEDFQDEYYIE